MCSLHVSGDLSPQLLARYQSAISRFNAISIALGSGMKTVSTPLGPQALEEKRLIPTSRGSRTSTNDELLERLARLATTPQTDETPPLVTYTETPTENGAVVSATPEFRRWMRSRYPGYGTGSHGEVSAPSSPSKGVGGKLNRFKPS